MSNEREKLAKEIFADALEKADPAERAAWLIRACGEDGELLQRVEALLQAYGNAGAFLKEPTAAPTNGTITIAPELTEKPGDKIGHYKLLQQIGEGGGGVVYMADQIEPIRRKVAFKVIKLGMDTKQVITRFEAERQALALMDHPNIARALDAGATESGRPYFVMELVRGMRITDYCDRNNLPTDQRLDLFMQVCNAIQHAHQKGIIHRDIKPSNILVTVVDGRSVPKVIDFGIAKAIGQQLTEKTIFTAFEQFIGTPAYMSPEQTQLSGVDVDTRSDIYSLGVLLYELLTSHTPFEPKTLLAAGLDEMRHIIREKDPPCPSTRLSTLEAAEQTTIAKRRQSEPPKLIHQVRGDLDWIVMKCLEKSRAHRYETASALTQDIQRHLGNEPIAARAPSKLYRFRKLVQRNKLAFAAGGVATISLVIGLTLATIMFFRERAARRQTEQQAAIASAVNDFLQNLLRQADSREQADAQFKADPDLKVRDALQRASQRIGDRFKDQPTTELAIRSAIGDALRGIGRDTEAVPHLVRAMELSQARLGAEHLRTLKCMDDLAATYTDAGYPERALPLLQKTLEVRKARLGSGHTNTLATMFNLGVAYKQAGKLNEAALLLEEALKLRKAKLGPDHPDTLRTTAELGAAYFYAGNPDRALFVFERTLKLRRAKLGLDHPDTLLSVNNLVAAYLKAGKLEEALGLLEENWTNQIAKLGKDHPETLSSKHNLGLAYVEIGKLDKGIQLLQEVLITRRATVGQDHPHTLLTLNLLADAYQQARRLHDATLLFEHGIQLAKGKLGPDHFITLMLTGNGGTAYQEAGELERALPLLEEAASRTKALLGPDNPQSLLCLDSLAWAYEAAGQSDKAVPLLEQTLDLEKAKLGPTHEYTLTGMNNLALAYQEAGKLDRALPLLEEAVKLSTGSFGTNHSATRRAMNDLVAAYLEAGNLDQAVLFCDAALKSRRAKLDPEHPDTLTALANLSKCLLRKGDYQTAEQLARECFELRQKTTPKDWRTFAVQTTLGMTMLAQQRHGEAEPMLVQGYAGLNEVQRSIPPGSRRELRNALQALVRLYDAWGKSEETARWRRALEPFPTRPLENAPR